MRALEAPDISTKLDSRELYNPGMITKILQKIESYSQKSINAVKNLVPRVMVGIEGITGKLFAEMFIKDEYDHDKGNLYNVVSTNVRSLKSVICDATGQISQAFDQLSRNVTDLQLPYKRLLALKSDLEQSAGLIAKIALNDTNAAVYSLARSLQVRPVVEAMELYTLKSNLSEISINVTLYYPLWARKLSAPMIADYFGIPLTDSSDAKFWFYFEPLRGVPFHKLRPNSITNETQSNFIAENKKLPIEESVIKTELVQRKGILDLLIFYLSSSVYQS
ncbi:hypothetical protein ACTXT7_005915 [Hymenolepis weldensis]